MFSSEVFLNKSFDIMRRSKSFLFCNSKHQKYLHLSLCIFIFETPSIDSFFRSSQLILLKYAEHLERYYKELYSNIRITLLATWATSRRPTVRDFTLRFSLLSQRRPQPSCDAHIRTKQGIHTCVCFHITFLHSRTHNTNVLFIRQIYFIQRRLNG